MENFFDFHYHLLFKHYISKKRPLTEDIRLTGFVNTLNDIMGGAFESQSSPQQVKNSGLKIGVISILAMEHAFANRIFNKFGFDLAKELKLDQQIIKATREGETSYYQEFKNQVNYYIGNAKQLLTDFNIHFVSRKDFEGKTFDQVREALKEHNGKTMLFSIEGGHNLSNVPIRKGIPSPNPELQLKEIQDSSLLDYISLNLCHLSEIPEQSMGGFAQGINSTAAIAFSSEDFMPKAGFGLTEKGKKVIKQALTHPERPILIDVKHMSLYTRLHFYRYRDKLISEFPQTARLPIISSHSGFTFMSMSKLVKEKLFKSYEGVDAGKPVSQINALNRKIGRTDDIINKALYCNPWTINLYDEDIIEIMESGGMIGISLDQRILGASNPLYDSARDKYFQKEYIPRQEWEKLFRDGLTPTEERLFPEAIAPGRAERHIMLLCLHIVYAVRLALKHIAWPEDKSPWDCICIGSDYDGLINPINGFETVQDLSKLPGELRKYLPMADKYLHMHEEEKEDAPALKYDSNKRLDMNFLDKVIEKFVYTNGFDFISRFLSNWKS